MIASLVPGGTGIRLMTRVQLSPGPSAPRPQRPATELLVRHRLDRPGNRSPGRARTPRAHRPGCSLTYPDPQLDRAGFLAVDPERAAERRGPPGLLALEPNEVRPDGAAFGHQLGHRGRCTSHRESHRRLASVSRSSRAGGACARSARLPEPDISTGPSSHCADQHEAARARAPAR